jgi:hypothetical protein
MALVMNKRTGKVSNVPAHYIGHPSLGGDLVAMNTSVAPTETEQPVVAKKDPKSFFKASPVKDEGQPAPETENETNEDK